MGAYVDLHNGELVKEEEQVESKDEDFDSIQEKCFMEAFMNCMTPLHVAATLGYDEIALYLIDRGADVDLQSNFRRYTALHMAVLSNKPEMLIELLTKSQANSLLEDGQGRTLLDLIYAYNPSYVESFQALLENL
jgi:ankyrin repeat protein